MKNGSTGIIILEGGRGGGVLRMMHVVDSHNFVFSVGGAL